MKIRQPSETAYRACRARWDALAKPLDGLGRFEEMICRLAAMQGTADVEIEKRCLLVFCADNGVVRQDVSQSGQEVTAEVAAWMGAGASTACHLAKPVQTDVLPIDIGMAKAEQIPGVKDRKIACGTKDITVEPAMTREACQQAIETGKTLVRECLEQGYQIVATGEMGIGNTTTSAAVTAALLHLSPEQVTGYGAGLSDAGRQHKQEVIAKALERLPAVCPPEEILRQVGGLDLAALTGAFLGAAAYGVPIVLDGLITAAAALLAERMAPGTRSWMLASHIGKEPAMAYLLQALELQPVLDAELALGEGSGAVLLFSLLDPICAYYRNGKRFVDTPIEAYRRFGSGEPEP